MYYRLQLKDGIVVGKYASELPFEEPFEDSVDVTEKEYNDYNFGDTYEINALEFEISMLG
jgi:hypothetical protein